MFMFMFMRMRMFTLTLKRLQHRRVDQSGKLGAAGLFGIAAYLVGQLVDVFAARAFTMHEQVFEFD
jgi:hypothetical protein